MSDAAITTIVTGIVTITVLWLKLRHETNRTGNTVKDSEANLARKSDSVEKKLDDNTEVTKTATKVAATNAKVAADAAASTSEKVDTLAGQLNGKLDDKITAIVKAHLDPFIATVKAHVEQDDKNMLEIRAALGELRDRIRG